MADGISFEEATGAAPKGRKAPPSGGISFEQAVGRPAVEETDAARVRAAEQGAHPLLDFGKHAVETVRVAGEAAVREPKQTLIGEGKALASGAVSLTDLSMQGIAGIATAAVGKGFDTGQQAAAKFTETLRNAATAVTGINLAPEGKAQEAAANLLALLPEGINAAGETVYEKTGSALAGAGTQALGTLLTIKPTVAADMLRSVAKKDSVAGAKVGAALDELTVKDPKAASAIRDHVATVDPKLAKVMQRRMDKAMGEEPEVIGNKAAKADVAEKVEQIPAGKPRIKLKPKLRDEDTAELPILTPEQLSAGMRDAVREGYQTPWKAPSGSVEYLQNAKPVMQSEVKDAFKSTIAPGGEIVQGKLTEYFDQAVRTFAPESLGPEAKLAGATLARNIAEEMRRTTTFYTRSRPRWKYWNAKGEFARDFIKGYESGKDFEDPILWESATFYRKWNADIAAQDKNLGFQYEDVDNYMHHIFEDGPGVTKFLQRQYGARFGDPGFIKDRTFQMYDEAMKAGFKPKFTNPEDIMLARQHASDVARTKIQTLRELGSYGLAKPMRKGDAEPPKNFPSTQWRSPTGEWYWVHDNANAVLHNYFNTKSLWAMKGIGGDIFRGMMNAKNAIIPVKLGVSLFHPLHVATIDNATGMVRASKELLSGTSSPAKWMGQMVRALTYTDLAKETLGTLPGVNLMNSGNHILRAFQGKIADIKLTDADCLSLQYMTEGGMVPTMSAEFKSRSIENFRRALADRSPAVLWHGPLAVLSLMSKPMFEVWIPSLKVASYLQDVRTALKTDPSLIDSTPKRLMAFRKIAKSVDNRYGEMAYNTLFWNRWVKDLGVANTLSLGWQLGFIREYGGGMLDLGQALAKPGEAVGKVKEGLLDRPLFVTFYTTQALAYGGLMTYALSGSMPQGLMDYIYPKTAPPDEKGNSPRSNTMFYTREFASIYLHSKKEGVVGGLTDIVESKSSGLIGMAGEWAKGVNTWGEEIRDPNAPAFKQLEQTVAQTMSEMEPISIAAMQKGDDSMKAKVLAFSGFTPAPKYVTDSPTASAIKQTYQKYYAPKQTPYEKASLSPDVRKARDAYEKGDFETYDKAMDSLEEKLEKEDPDHAAQDVRKLSKSITKGTDPLLTMFARMDWQQQKQLLDKMTPEEREQYLPHANKEHLRYSYEAPEDEAPPSR